MFEKLATSFLIAFGILMCAGCKPSYHFEEEGLPEVVDFNFHVKPILSDRCFTCHGPDANKREANLRLDQPESALNTRLESGKYALVPGSLRRSQVFKRITAPDPEERMPPQASNLSLNDREIAILAKWIEQGAVYKPHWSLLPVENHNPPETKKNDWVRNPIDRFVLDKLAAEGISPNEEAGKEILLRRVTLDLTGLPPTIDEIDAFLADQSEDAYEKVVDKLLATASYAERMALEWMDLSRYADSHGYSQDGYRFMWPWRDWIIKAYNENMPFDQFVTWQLAGDLLPNPTQEQRLATAFLRNQRINSEGGIVPAEYLVEYAVERTATVGTVFMGLTLACARCHDHKYDPVSQKDFYQLYAFFNNVNEAGLVQKDGNSGPQVLLVAPSTQQKIDELDAEIKERSKQLEDRAQQILANDPGPIQINLDRGLISVLDFEQITKEPAEEPDDDSLTFISDLVDKAFKHEQLGEPEYEAHDNGQALKFTAYDGVAIDDTLANFDRLDSFSMAFKLRSHAESDHMIIFMKLGNKNAGYRGYQLALKQGKPSFQMISAYPANQFEVQAHKPFQPESWSDFAITYNGSGNGAGVRMYINGQPLAADILIDQLTQTIINKDSRNLRIGGRMQEQLEIDEGYALIDDFKIFDRALSELEVKMLFDGPGDPVRFDIALQKAHYLEQLDTPYQRTKQQLQLLLEKKNAILDSLPGVMVMDDLPEKRPAHILSRGQYNAPTERVFPDTPDVILPFSSEYEKNRLGIAKWLLNDKHPLTARVTINRYWNMYFGQGIVETIEDFGSQGALPTHPELLDWLADNFRKSGWDVKAFQKLIVTSATYRQSSFTSKEKRLLDPDNKWLSRGPSQRLSAETLRDQALAASGLLVKKIGGPGVKPYQPAGLWSEKSFFSQVLKKYEPGTGDDLYRRSMYTFWRRTAPPPSMILFDAPTRDQCTVRRQQTNTPLQALVLLNDPQFVEAARVLAAHALTQYPEDKRAQITQAYRRLSGQSPTQETIELLHSLYVEEEIAFNQEPKEALTLISVGQAPSNDLPPATHAALTVVCNTIMSFDEVVMKR